MVTYRWPDLSLVEGHPRAADTQVQESQSALGRGHDPRCVLLELSPYGRQLVADFIAGAACLDRTVAPRRWGSLKSNLQAPSLLSHANQGAEPTDGEPGVQVPRRLPCSIR